MLAVVLPMMRLQLATVPAGAASDRKVRAWAARVLQWSGCHVTVHGAEHLTAVSCALLVANHASALDSVVLMASLAAVAGRISGEPRRPGPITPVRLTPRTRSSRLSSAILWVGVLPLAESLIGLFKTEVIQRKGPWRSLEAVEFAKLVWVDWFNESGLRRTRYASQRFIWTPSAHDVLDPQGP